MVHLKIEDRNLLCLLGVGNLQSRPKLSLVVLVDISSEQAVLFLEQLFCSTVG